MANLERFQLRGFGNRVFAVAGKIRPAAVRDSVWRAERFVKALKAAGHLDKPGEALIVGKGPVAIVIIRLLLEAGFKVSDLDGGPDSRSPIAGVTSREICATTFDYPKSHYTQRRYPLVDEPPTVFDWHSSTGSEVFNALDQKLDGYLDANPEKQFVPLAGVKLQSCVPDGTKVALTFERDEVSALPRVTDVRVDLVVICIGLGAEQLSLDGSLFASHGFFDDRDPLMWGEMSKDQSILIAGGGDGAIGDFVRLTTGEPSPFRSISALPLPDHAIEALREADGAMWQTFAAGNGEPGYLVDIQGRLIAVADDLWSTDRKVRDDVAKLVNPHANRRPAIQVAVTTPYFSHTYTANRIAAHLIARYLADDRDRNGGLSPFLVGHRLIAIEPAPVAAGLVPHVCSGDAQECAMFHHVPVFSPTDLLPVPDYFAACCEEAEGPAWKQTVSTKLPRPTTEFSRILLRFGPKAVESMGVLPANLVAAIRDRLPLVDVPHYYLP